MQSDNQERNEKNSTQRHHVLKKIKENVRGSLSKKIPTIWGVAKLNDIVNTESKDILGVGHSGMACIPSD